MSQPVSPAPAKLIIGVFTAELDLIVPVAERLCREFGLLDLVSAWFPFDYTDYYAAEMGTGLFRRMMAFKKLIAQEDMAGIKHTTNGIESDFSGGRSRRINIDPGYLLRERFVLATGKNFSHRIHIGRGIYADLTLMYKKGTFQTLPWTYPDYAAADMQNFLKRVRSKYVFDLREKEEDHD